MDARLNAVDTLPALQRIARAYLDQPSIEPMLGQIRLAPHQVEAAARATRMIGTHDGAVLADATGMGKTYVALAVARLLGPALIVAPASLRTMWRDAMQRARIAAAFVSYEALSHGTSTAAAPALLILDEAHHARNPSARRYGAIANLAWGAGVLALTATPIHNGARDLRAILALFLGSRAFTFTDDHALHYVIRRPRRSAGDAMPTLAAPQWHEVPRDPRLLPAITGLPAPVATADGSIAQALMVLGLIRAWCSSEAALRAVLRRRLQRAAVLMAALDAGHLPTRSEAASWPLVDASVQLGIPGLLASAGSRIDDTAVRGAIATHVDGVRQVLRLLDEGEDAADAQRARVLATILAARPDRPIVAFTQFADTAAAMFERLAPVGSVAMVTGRGGRIASGRISADEIVRRFDVDGGARATRAMPLGLLIATDVLSEGLSLRRVGALVHLDLPWTMARLEQRVGRVRRPGSPHAIVEVHALGPPLESRELLSVVRALRRKARISAGLRQGDEGVEMPILGKRLARATVASARHNEAGSREALHAHLTGWARAVTVEGTVPVARVALACLVTHGPPRVLAISGGRVSGATGDLLEAVVAVSAVVRQVAPGPGPGAADSVAMAPEIGLLRQWLERERARAMVRAVIEAAGPAHARILQQINELVARAPRSERSSLADRVARCRDLVTHAQAIGAERALERLGCEATLDLDRIEHLLAAHSRPRPGTDSSSGRSVLVIADPGDGVRAFEFASP